MKKILLINPKYEMESSRVVSDDQRIALEITPLALVTISALTPDEFHVDIWDECIRGPIEDHVHELHHTYDLVGLTALRVSLLRARKVAAFFRQRGTPVAIGGPGVSATPDRCRGYFDIFFIGEAEITWPEFLRDWQADSYRSEYRQIEQPDISLSPMPRWDSIASDLDKYGQGCVQTTRGCPFDCEFCDVVYLNGRRVRHKSIERVCDEVQALQRLGVSRVFFADDNSVGDPRYTKDLLWALIPLNNSFPKPLSFGTQATINVAKHEELLRLLADANFYELCIGIESPNEESLKEMGKFHNLQGDIVEMVHRVLSYGISVRGTLISGFDHDDVSIFDKLYKFIQEAHLTSVGLHMLSAPRGTRLWRRLREEGRVVDVFQALDKITLRMVTNVIPKGMTRVELMTGFRDLYMKVFSWDSFKERILGFVALSNGPPKVWEPTEIARERQRIETIFDLDQEDRQAITEIFEYTEKNALYLLGRVRDLVVQFIRYSQSGLGFIPKLEQQIELESSGELTYELDNYPLTIPRAFRDAYKRMFPDIHRRIYLNVRDKNKVPECLVEVFVEFLMHAEEFTELKEYHTSLLDEIVDRSCARFNGQDFPDFVPMSSVDVAVPNVKTLRLHDDVLKSVEQELCRLAEL